MATLTQLTNAIEKKPEIFERLYLDNLIREQRIQKWIELANIHREKFLQNRAEAECGYYVSSGRIEWIGNHTDHQHGPVITSAVDAGAVGIATKNESKLIKIYDAKYKVEHTINLESITSPDEALKRSKGERWKSLYEGVVAAFVSRGLKVGGVDYSMMSEIESGSGISSSANIAVNFAEMLNSEFNEGKIDKAKISEICQEAEHKYWGKKCGLMDQNASARGGAMFIDFANPSKPEVVKLRFLASDMQEKDLVVGIAQYGSHGGLDEFYNQMGDDMRFVAGALGNYKVLRDVPDSRRQRAVLERLVLKRTITPRQEDRAKHYFNEERRVLTTGPILDDANKTATQRMRVFLNAINQSGTSSEKYLHNVIDPTYPVDDWDNQRLFNGYNISRRFTKTNGGAARVHGGGIAGTSLTVIERKFQQLYTQMMENIFGEGTMAYYGVRDVPAGKVPLIKTN